MIINQWRLVILPLTERSLGMTIFKRAGKQHMTHLANYSFPFNVIIILALENVEKLNPFLKLPSPSTKGENNKLSHFHGTHNASYE